jgi:hypothetical protein
MTRSPLFSRAVQAAGLCLLTLAILVICSPVRSVPRQPDRNPEGEKFRKRLLEIARSYETYGRVDDEYRWAPYLCRMPSPGLARFSATADKKTHGQKLYSLFAFDRAKYLAFPKDGQAVGQVLVKQSWIPKEVDDKGKELKPVVHHAKSAKRKDKVGFHGVDGKDAFLPYARKAGKLYKAERQGPLFIMYKVDPKTRNTDIGWVYGTVSADGKTVTSAGRVASCMKCHLKAEHDRLFGLPASAPLPRQTPARLTK